jgi:glutathione S-transferase
MLFVAWFCPFAQRAWVAAGLSQSDVAIVRDAIVLDSLGKHARFMLKSEELVSAAPPLSKKISVPLFVSEEFCSFDSVAICAKMMNASDAEEASARRLDELCGPLFYGSLKPVIFEERFRDWVSLLQSTVVATLKKQPFLSGRDEPGIEDVVVFPFLWRAFSLGLFEKYRGLRMPSEFPVEWLNRMLALEAVQKTLPIDTDEKGFSLRLFDVYPIYAVGFTFLSSHISFTSLSHLFLSNLFLSHLFHIQCFFIFEERNWIDRTEAKVR